MGGPARLPCPCPWISQVESDVYDVEEVPKAVRRLCSILLRLSACILQMFFVAPSLLLDNIATVQGTRSKHPVASLSKVANVVLVVIAILYVSSLSIRASSACRCGLPPH